MDLKTHPICKNTQVKFRESSGTICAVFSLWREHARQVRPQNGLMWTTPQLLATFANSKRRSAPCYSRNRDRGNYRSSSDIRDIGHGLRTSCAKSFAQTNLCSTGLQGTGMGKSFTSVERHRTYEVIDQTCAGESVELMCTVSDVS